MGPRPEKGNKRVHPVHRDVASLGQLQLLRSLVHHELAAASVHRRNAKSALIRSQATAPESLRAHSRATAEDRVRRHWTLVDRGRHRGVEGDALALEAPEGFWRRMPLLLCMLLLAHAQCFRYDGGLAVPVPRSTAGAVDEQALAAGVAALLCEGGEQAEQRHGGGRGLLVQLIGLLQRWIAAHTHGLASDSTKVQPDCDQVLAHQFRALGTGRLSKHVSCFSPNLGAKEAPRFTIRSLQRYKIIHSSLSTTCCLCVQTPTCGQRSCGFFSIPFDYPQT